MKYRIVKYGNCFRVQYKHRFLPFWFYFDGINMLDGMTTGPYDFPSFERAEEFVSEQIESDKPIKTEVVKVYEEKNK